MQYRSLGSSSLQISATSFGCMSLKNGGQEAIDLIDQALDLGINFFDTADLYEQGQNELLLGKALKDKRNRALIATKVGNQWRPDGSGWDWNPRKAYILSAVNESLRRLQVSHIDLYQLHGGTLEDPIDDVIEAFERLREQGKIRYYGISSIRPNVIREYVRRSNIVSVMAQYSLLDRRPEETVLPLLKEHNIGVLARGTVAGGLLVSKPATPYLDHPVEAVQKAASAIKERTGASRHAAQTALQFVLQQPALTSAVVGIHTPGQLADAIAAIAAPPLIPEELAVLQQAAPALLYTQHR